MKDLEPGGDVLTWLGVQYRTVLATADTGGAMSIVESISPPQSGPPRHIHHDADETFYLLSGECEFLLGTRRFVRGPGATVFVPRGTEHTFRVVSAEPCRHLVILTPGGFEGFFADMSAGQFRIPEDMATISQSAARHHLSFTGPPLAAG